MRVMSVRQLEHPADSHSGNRFAARLRATSTTTSLPSSFFSLLRSWVKLTLTKCVAERRNPFLQYPYAPLTIQTEPVAEGQFPSGRQ